MSAMMATSAPGPIPVPSQTSYIPPNVTVRGGHARQGSMARPVTSAGETSPRRPAAQNPRSAAAPMAEALGADNGADRPRPVGPGSGPQGRAMPPAGPRVHAPATAQRPATSHATQPVSTAAATAGPSGTQRSTQPQSQTTSFRPTAPASRQADPEPRPATTTAGNPASAAAARGGTSNQQPQSGSKSSSFPHAFERWEMLSSRWEGLTGYWVSRLEQNRQELSHLPLEQEMSRQITDLAAAGANLFQALIELQRLRASSERKFQRWFFETRADQERSQEVSSELERTIRAERQQRADAMTRIRQLEIEKATAEKLAEETRRELQISRDECRRAWEELGRREQEERDITASLRDGHPALVGGVQVTPMPMPGVPSRSNSQSTRPRTATGPPPGSSSGPQTEGHSDRPLPSQSPARGQHPLAQETRYSRDSREMQPPETQAPESDVSDNRQPAQQSSTAAATARTTTAPGTPPTAYPPVLPAQQPQTSINTTTAQQGFYQQPHASLHDIEAAPTNPSPVSYVTNPNVGSPVPTESSIAFETDEHGNIVVDEHGQPVIARRPGDEDDEDYSEREWGTYPSYDGDGYGGNGGSIGYGGGVGIGSGWDSYQRHHHPTRLSDVLEEDERATISDGRRSALG